MLLSASNETGEVTHAVFTDQEAFNTITFKMAPFRAFNCPADYVKIMSLNSDI